MSTRPNPFYALRVATLGTLLVSGGAALLIWMVSADIGPFHFFGSKTDLHRKAGSVSVELRFAGGSAPSLEAAVERVGPQRLLIHVSNLGAAPASGAVLVVRLLAVDRVLAVRGTQLGAEAPAWQYVGTSDDIEISLPDIPAAAHRTWHVDLARTLQGDA